MPEKLFLETTEVSADKSRAELTAVLVKAGARTINTSFRDGKANGLSWSMQLYGNLVYFDLPVKVDPVYKILRKRKGRLTFTQDTALQATAERVAWRQLLMWVKVQMALIELQMVEFAQVFLPYVQSQEGGATLWDVFRENRLKALPPAS